jgi:hypothetical protein
MYSMAGWDERLGLAVLIDDGTNRTLGWDGKKWHSLGRFPTMGWRPFVTGQAPDGSLIVVQKQRSHGERRAICHELGDGEWHACDTSGLEDFGGIARNPRSARSFVFGPLFANGRSHSLGRYEDRRIVPAGQLTSSLGGVSTGGRVRFLAHHYPRRFTIENGSLTEAGELPESIAQVFDASGEFALTSKGEIHVDGTMIAAPAGFKPRAYTSMGGDGRGAVLVVGGQVSYLSRSLTDVWRFDGSWKQLTQKGAKPAVSDASVTYDPRRDVWLIVNGSRKNQLVNLTQELDAKKWTTFVSMFSDRGKQSEDWGPALSLLTRDERTGEIFCVT